jgi:flagellar basal-body rod modification protein FlgD
MNGINETSHSLLKELGPPETTPATGGGTDLGQEDFLELLLTQLKNQDPLSPMENAEFMGQLAQFSTVSSVQAVEQIIGDLSTSLQSAQALQATSLVGRSVLVADSQALLEPGEGIGGRIDVPLGAGALTVTVEEPSGRVVRSMNLGVHPPGALSFEWDGSTPDGEEATPGEYRLRATAVVDGQSTGLDVATTARVQSVSLGRNGEGVTVNLTGSGAHSLDQVLEIL